MAEVTSPSKILLCKGVCLCSCLCYMRVSMCMGCLLPWCNVPVCQTKGNGRGHVYGACVRVCVQELP